MGYASCQYVDNVVVPGGPGSPGGPLTPGAPIMPALPAMCQTDSISQSALTETTTDKCFFGRGAEKCLELGALVFFSLRFLHTVALLL